MSNIRYYLDVFSNILLVSVIVVNILSMFRVCLLVRLLVCIIAICFSIAVPIYMDCSLVWIMRGIIGSLSITSMIVILVMFANSFFNLKIKVIDIPSGLIIGVVGSVLYLSVLGFLPCSLYDFGFKLSIYFLIITFSLLCVVYFFNKLLAWIFLFAVIGYLLAISNSTNIWDYLIDPLLWGYSIVTVLLKMFRLI